jgi:cobyrinic acid a,c-diamide synthase
MARSVAAIVHGYRTFDPDVNVAGVILNRVGSEAHANLLREALPDIPVLGALPRDAELEVPERHLGLVPVAERAPRARRVIDRLAASIEAHCDIEALLGLARSAPPLHAPAWSPGEAPPSKRVAIARGPAFSFHYEENLELLRGAGAELIPFDPLTDALPQADALILAGGFPEIFGAELSDNAGLRMQVAGFKGPILAECGGLLYLTNELDGHPMCGVIDATATMTRKLTLGYRELTTTDDHPVWPAGTSLRAHEFHYSKVTPERRTYVCDNVHASYLHTHWAATPEVARRLVAACG